MTTKAVRVLGFAGVAGALALMQACAPTSAEDVNVDVRGGAIGVACGRVGEVACTTAVGAKAPPASYPRPPQGYQVKWSTCAYWVEGEAAVRNNSRVVNIAADGTVPMQRAEPVTGGMDNFRRVKVAKIPQALIRGKGFDKRAGGMVEFVKIGQVVTTKEQSGAIVQWVVGSDFLGAAVYNRLQARYEYRDHCFRNPAAATGKDTAGWVSAGHDLALSCVVEEMNQEWNALSAYGWYPIVNHADNEVPTANNPATRPHPDDAFYAGYKVPSHLYTKSGAALNDLNGTERDELTNYMVGEGYCHMIVNAGYEVPGAKRPATRSLPAPGVVNGGTMVTWRPVNGNVLIANAGEAVAPVGEPGPVEPEPEPSPVDAPVAESDTAPM